MINKQNIYKKINYLLVFVILIYSLVSASNPGDFMGYVQAGNLLLKKQFIYNSIYNTWPPFFSIISMPLALLDKISPYLNRIIWLGFNFFCLFYIIKSIISFLENKCITFKELWFQEMTKPKYSIAFLISTRAIMDNIMYMQINLPMLAAMIILIEKNTLKKSSILALSISSKIYNILALPVLFFNGKFKVLFYAFLFVILSFVLCFLVFGYSETISLYQYWVNNIANGNYDLIHRNQSLISSFYRLFSENSIPVNFQQPIYILPDDLIKRIYYIFLIIVFVLIGLLFRKFLFKNNIKFYFISIILACLVILFITPICWKANYIYTLPSFFFLMYFYQINKPSKLELFFFGFVIFGLVLSAEIFVGRNIMFFLEKQNIMPISLIVLTIIFIKNSLLYLKFQK